MRTLITLARLGAQALYRVMRLLPVRNKVVFLSRQADRPSRDFTMLAAELHRLDPSLRIVTRCRFIGRTPIARMAYTGELLGQMYHLATARVAVVDGYIIPVSLLDHRPGLFVVQMWHALGAIKRFGHQSLDKPGGRSGEIASAMRMHHNYDVVLCGGPATAPVFSEAFCTPVERVAPLGLPRVDFLADRGAVRREASERLTMRFPRLADSSRTRVLYAPTFRKRGETGYSAAVAAFDPDRFTLVVKPHDLEDARLDAPHVVDATGVEVLELLHVCDVVVTDYSAVAFEAAAAGLPVYYYVFDIDDYREAHGLNLDPLAEFGADASRDIAPLVARILNGDYDAEASSGFAERYLPEAPYHCTAAIADLIIDHVKRP